jgi:hypothetical protein
VGRLVFCPKKGSTLRSAITCTALRGLLASTLVTKRLPVPRLALQLPQRICRVPCEPVLGQRVLPGRAVVAVVRAAQLQPLCAGQCGQVGHLLRITLGPEQIADLDQAQHGQQRQHDPASW